MRNHAQIYNLTAKIAGFLDGKEGMAINRSILRNLLEHQKSTSHERRHRLNRRYLTYMKLSKGN